MFKTEYAVEIGSSFVTIYKKDYGIVLKEPSVVAIELENGKEKYITFGADAKRMAGRTADDLQILHPVKNGVIQNIGATIAMMQNFFSKVQMSTELSFNILFCVPCGLNEAELGDFTDVGLSVGAKVVNFVPSVLTALIGAGINISKSSGVLSLNIGGGTCSVASISLNRIVKGCTAHVGGKRIDEAIAIYLEEFHGLMISEMQAEKIKIEAGSLFLHDKTNIEVNGVDLETKQPKSEIITSANLRDTLDFYFEKIVSTVMKIINESSSDLVADFYSNGIVVTGGLANITGLEYYLKNALSIPIIIADSPENAVVLGAGKLIADKANLKEILEKN